MNHLLPIKVWVFTQGFYKYLLQNRTFIAKKIVAGYPADWKHPFHSSSVYLGSSGPVYASASTNNSVEVFLLSYHTSNTLSCLTVNDSWVYRHGRKGFNIL